MFPAHFVAGDCHTLPNTGHGCDDWSEVLNLLVGVVDRCLGVDW